MTPDEFARAEQLVRFGISLDAHELEKMRTGLRVYPDPSLPGSTISLTSGQTGYILNVLIANESNARLSPRRIVFGGQGVDPSIRLLPDPRRQCSYRRRRAHSRIWGPSQERQYHLERDTYTFSANCARFPRESVLNHRISRGSVLLPGEEMDGLLLALGDLPLCVEDGGFLRSEMSLAIFDQYDRSREIILRFVAEGPSRAKDKKRALTKPVTSRLPVPEYAVRLAAQSVDPKSANAGVAVSEDEVVLEETLVS